MISFSGISYSYTLIYLFQSVDNEILLWEPQLKENSPGEVSNSFHSLNHKCYKTEVVFCCLQGTSDVLQRYPVPMSDIWFIKFSCDFQLSSLAIGDQKALSLYTIVH